ncbi:hypothetical protein PG993_012025 [Apiospora rasikravindrae]|uniref:Uncharacterized protein n=1 Tax=Apiospora rasikravindrae TaxID=990691 RepID=A0ABR1S3N0_9PEZI
MSTSRPPRSIRRGPAPHLTTQTPPSTPLRTATTPTVKRVIWTGAFAAVAIVGSIYGAGLKTKQEFQAEKQQIIESTPEDRIKDLEHRRGVLMSQKIPLERKLADLRSRMQAKAAEEASQSQAKNNKTG